MNTNLSLSTVKNQFTHIWEQIKPWVERLIQQPLEGLRPWSLPQDSQRRLESLEQGLHHNRAVTEVNQNGINLIKKFEGFRRQIYRDAAGHPTIGYGHLIKANERHTFINGINQSQATELLKQDVQHAQQAVNELVKVPLNQKQFNALTSFTYNVGKNNLASSTLLKKLNAGQYNEAGLELRRWVHAGGEKLPGLIYRRQVEMELFRDTGH